MYVRFVPKADIRCAKSASLFNDRLKVGFQCDFVCSIWWSCAAPQAAHMRMGSIGLLYATRTRTPHCSHSQLNDGVGGTVHFVESRTGEHFAQLKLLHVLE